MNRPLNAIEFEFWLLNRLAAQNFSYCVHLSGPVTESILRDALDLAQKRHPSLGWRIQQGGMPEFSSQEVPQIPLKCVERSHKKQWLEEALKGVHRNFSAEGPLLRTVLLPSEGRSELIMEFSHVFVDGLSGLTVLKDVLDMAGKLSRGEKPGIEHCHRVPPSMFDLLENKKCDGETPSESETYSIKSQSAYQIMPDIDASVEDMTTQAIVKEFSAAEMHRLVGKCKEHAVSVNDAISAAVLQSLQVLRGIEDIEIGCLTAVNMRPFLNKALDEDVGFYSSGINHKQPIDPSVSLWEAAYHFKQSVENEMSRGSHYQVLHEADALLRMYKAGKVTEEDLLELSISMMPDISLSNLGRIPLPRRYEEITLEAIYPIGTAHSDVRIEVVSCTLDVLHISFLYAFPFISEERASRIAEDTRRRLTNDN